MNIGNSLLVSIGMFNYLLNLCMDKLHKLCHFCCVALTLSFLESGNGAKSKILQGLFLYTISKGDVLIVWLKEELQANSTTGMILSQFLGFSPMDTTFYNSYLTSLALHHASHCIYITRKNCSFDYLISSCITWYKILKS